MTESGQSGAPQPERNRPKGIIFVALGLVLFLAGSLMIVALRYGGVLPVSRPDGLVAGLVWFAGGVVIAIAGVRLAARGHKLQTRDADQVIAQSDKRPVLYLRSFHLDETDSQNTLPLGPGIEMAVNPWESSIASGFAGTGPLVAIGRPGERLATTGASRVYVGDDEWQEKVAQLADDAQMVVWAYGRTEGLRWEIAKLVRDVPPEKLIIALPFWKVPEKRRAALWQGVVEDIGHVFPRPLPAEIGSALFIQFTEDWTATPVLPKPPPLLVRTAAIGGWNRITDSIYALMESRGAPPRRRSFGEYVLYSALTSVWLVIGSFLFLMFYYLLVRPFVEIGLIESFVRAVF